MTRNETISSCRLCGNKPTKTEYRTDSGGYTSRRAAVECSCGNVVEKSAENFTGIGQTGWDFAESRWRRAMQEALADWNRLNS